MAGDDFIRTIEDEEVDENMEDDADDGIAGIDRSFTFDAEEDPIQNAWDFHSALEQSIDKSSDKQTSIDYKIEQINKKKRKRADYEEDLSESEDESVEQNEEGDDEEQEDSQAESDEERDEASAEEEEEDEEDDPVIEDDEEGPNTFTDLHLSRVLLKACTQLGYEKPTPIQRRCIPFALAGKDICGSAHTGSGKTAAFMLPVLERLLYRPKRVPVTRVLVLTPTRELAAQCSSMTEKLSQFSDIRTCLVVGGLSNKTQETALRSRPDIIVATPGRMIDHLRNAQSITLDSVEVLILDEADRLLDMGFTEEVKEIVKCCPKSRQTLLFSATMTKKVMKLAAISLKDPVYISVNKQLTVAEGLKQEFIRIKASREGDREAMLILLCKKTYKSRTIIFVRSKRYAHHLKILFGLFELSAAELHGNLTQTARLQALEDFRDEKVNYLIATDLASRGLDIMGIESVINFHMPKSHAQYVHRVGRTARAGKKGSSCSFVSEDDRPLLKEIIKKVTGTTVNQRKLPQQGIDRYKERIGKFQPDIERIVQQEREERTLRLAERDITKMENMLEYEDEINARPKRTWFQSEREKAAAKKNSKEAIFGPADEQEEPEKEEEQEEPEEYLSKRQFQRKLKQEAEKRQSARKQFSRKRQRQQLLEQSSSTTIKKQVKASKAAFKPPRFNTLESHRKPKSSAGGGGGGPPKKKKKPNPYANSPAKKKPGNEFPGQKTKFKSKKRYKRR